MNHRLRRWSNISTTLGQRLVFAGYLSTMFRIHYLHAQFCLCPLGIINQNIVMNGYMFYVTWSEVRMDGSAHTYWDMGSVSRYTFGLKVLMIK